MNFTNKRVLFVDDEPAIRKTLPVILRRYGFSVAVAGTVREALQEIEIGTFDLLICDLNIEKEGDGYTVIRAMREKYPRCVAIVLTAYPDVNSAVEGIRLGIDDYIVKPSNADALVAILAEKLAKRAAEEADPDRWPDLPSSRIQ
jgi:putative two-component system response regulator